ncbi:MAG: Hint domain-containing protein [Pseudomonadota bacterium]
MADEQFLLSGDQLATYSSSTVTFPPPTFDANIQLNDVSTLGTEADRFFLIRTQGDNDTVSNGDFFSVFPAVDDGTGTLVPGPNAIISGGGATPDAFDDTGAGDNYAIFGLFFGARFVVKLDGFDGATQVTFIEGQDNTGDDGELQLTEIAAAAVCFSEGTRIAVPAGSVPIETLKVGDLVKTYDGRDEAVRWIGSQTIEFESAFANENFRPVRISAGSLGLGLPENDMLVSRQHRMLLSSRIAKRMFLSREVLVTAIKLADLPGIFLDQTVRRITYVHFLLDKHEIVFAEGAPSESLFAGPEALKAVSHEAQKEILDIFPDLETGGAQAESARFIPSFKLQKKLIARHAKNQKSVLETFRPSPDIHSLEPLSSLP